MIWPFTFSETIVTIWTAIGFIWTMIWIFRGTLAALLWAFTEYNFRRALKEARTACGCPACKGEL